MGRIIFIFILLSLNSFASGKSTVFKKKPEVLKILGNEISVSGNVNDIPFSMEDIDQYLRDPQDRVSKVFKIPSFFKKDVKFWFYIYTVFSSHHAVLHDKENLGIIYDVIEFNEIKNSKALNIYTRFALQKKLTREHIKQFRKEFEYLKKNRATTKAQKKIISALKKVGFRIPKISKRREVMFEGLGKNLRSQKGQKDSIQRGINNHSSYAPTFELWLKEFNLPKELVWISFLESSFNIEARSKVGATGVWQFMKLIGKYFMPVNSVKDGRLSPAMSTLSAFHLLKQNKQILRRWDLAIPAYNSGTKHIIKARRKLKMSAPSLEQILTSYDHPHIGFASKHFYSEFLALSYAKAYREKFYDLSSKRPKLKKIDVYVTKCKLSPSWFFSVMKKKEPLTMELNAHLRHKNKMYPPGTIIFSSSNLTSRRYLKLTTRQLRNLYPKNYKKYIKNHSCSTK